MILSMKNLNMNMDTFTQDESTKKKSKEFKKPPESKKKNVEKDEFEGRESYMHYYAKIVLKDWLDHWANEGEKTYLEYPLLNEPYYNHKPWYEQKDKFENAIPTYKELKDNNIYPMCVVDVMNIASDGSMTLFEVYHKHRVSNEKFTNLEKAGYKRIYEISAEYILSETKIPSKQEMLKKCIKLL